LGKESRLNKKYLSLLKAAQKPSKTKSRREKNFSDRLIWWPTHFLLLHPYIYFHYTTFLLSVEQTIGGVSKMKGGLGTRREK